mgnify:CR=1 FL=1
MKYIILSILLLILFNINVKAHECILTGTTAKEITIYNTCLAHSKQNKPKNSVTESMMKLKIEKLKIENLNLKNKLLDIKLKIEKLKTIVDLYAK